MVQVKALLPPTRGGVASDQERAINVYAMQRGVGQLTSGQTNYVEHPNTVPSVIGTLSVGDVLLVPDLAMLSTSPSEQERLVFDLLGRGVVLHVMSLGGPVDAHLQALRGEAWPTAKALEEKVKVLEAEAVLTAKRHKEELDSAWDEAVNQVIATHPGYARTLVTKTAEEREPDQLGADIKRRRERLGLSQSQLAEAVNASKATISRIEQIGSGDAVPRILEALAAAEEAMPVNTEAMEASHGATAGA